MNNNSKQRNDQPIGGAERRPPRREDYTQMPLRPMTAMPAQKRPQNVPAHTEGRSKRPPMQGQRPPMQGQRPPMQGQRPPMQGQRPPVQGQRPPMQGQRPPIQGQRPPMQGQRPPMQGQRPPMQGQRPPMQGQRPPVQGQRPPMQGQRPPMQGQRPPVQGQRPPMQGQRPQRPPQARPIRPKEAPKRANDGWIVPEGSPIYTAEGRIYEGRPPKEQAPGGRPPAPQGAKRGAPTGRPSHPGQRKRPSPPPKKKRKPIDREKLAFFAKTFFTRLGVMLLIFALLGLWWYRSEFYSKVSEKKGSVSFTLEGVGSYEAKAATAYRGDVLYVDFTELAGWCNMVSVGSVNSMRFICTGGISETSSGKGGEEYAIFTSGSATVLINGTCVSLEAPCRTVNSHIWVPLSFVESYVGGISCDRGAKGTDILMVAEGNENLDEGEEITVNAAFCVKAQTPLPHAEYPS
ncbi:MAG: hypothetical protein IJD22_00500 [Clostridia bacterium]|nr:hypothetical protein [Clostridia bacterium]